MIHILNYKSLLLGCVSSCLISTAYANAEAESFGSLEITNLNLEDMTCGAEARHYHFTVENKSLSKVFLGPMVVGIDEDDSFPEDYKAVSVDRGNCGFRLGRLGKCEGTITFDPTKLACADEDHPIAIGEIEREIIAVYTKIEDEAKQGLFPRIATADVDVDVSPLGSLVDYSIIADDIIAGTDDDEPRAFDAMTTVEGNISYADDITDEDDIIFNCEYNTCGDVEFHESRAAAFKDAAQTWQVFRTAVDEDADNVKDGVVDCAKADYILDFSVAHAYLEVYPGTVYCVTGLDSTPAGPNACNDVLCDVKYTMPGEIAFKGDEDDIFVFVFPDIYELHPATPTIGFPITSSAFDILHNAKFSLTSDAVGTTVDNRNIFWILPENSTTSFDSQTRFAGNIITAGDIGVGTIYANEAAPFIMGGLYGLTDDVDLSEACLTEACPETTIDITGFTIDSDSNDE